MKYLKVVERVRGKEKERGERKWERCIFHHRTSLNWATFLKHLKNSMNNNNNNNTEFAYHLFCKILLQQMSSTMRDPNLNAYYGRRRERQIKENLRRWRVGELWYFFLSISFVEYWYFWLVSPLFSACW